MLTLQVPRARRATTVLSDFALSLPAEGHIFL